MILSIKKDNQSVSIECQEIDELKSSAADVLFGAYDGISRIFKQEVILEFITAQIATQKI